MKTNLRLRNPTLLLLVVLFTFIQQEAHSQDLNKLSKKELISTLEYTTNRIPILQNEIDILKNKIDSISNLNKQLSNSRFELENKFNQLEKSNSFLIKKYEYKIDSIEKLINKRDSVQQENKLIDYSFHLEELFAPGGSTQLPNGYYYLALDKIVLRDRWVYDYEEKSSITNVPEILSVDSIKFNQVVPGQQVNKDFYPLVYRQFTSKSLSLNSNIIHIQNGLFASIININKPTYNYTFTLQKTNQNNDELKNNDGRPTYKLVFNGVEGNDYSSIQLKDKSTFKQVQWPIFFVGNEAYIALNYEQNELLGYLFSNSHRQPNNYNAKGGTNYYCFDKSGRTIVINENNLSNLHYSINTSDLVLSGSDLLISRNDRFCKDGSCKLYVPNLIFLYKVHKVNVANWKQPNYDSTIQNCIVGKQVWMNQDLRTLSYQNGDFIPRANNEREWDDFNRTRTGCFKVLGNGSFVYNYYAVKDTRGLLPDGYRFPTKEDAKQLMNYAKTLGNFSASALVTYPIYEEFELIGGGLGGVWRLPNFKTDFNAGPGGYSGINYETSGNCSFFWISNLNQLPDQNSWGYMSLGMCSQDLGGIEHLENPENFGFSVRPIRM
jgi:uncharacterized protein (TIGR02145 family)